MATPAERPGPEFRLRWWTLALPAAVFAALLMLLTTGSSADAATAERQFLAQLIDTISGSLLP
jgi:hypothetical protein